MVVSHSTGNTHLDDLGVAVVLDQAGPVERRVSIRVDEAQVCPPLHQQPDYLEMATSTRHHEWRAVEVVLIPSIEKLRV